MLYQLFSHSAAAGVPLAVQLPTVVLLGCQQMEQTAVIGAGCGGCQKPYTAWHMQIDPRHLVVPCSGHVKKYSEKAIGEGEPLVGAHCAAGATRFPIREISQGRGFPPGLGVGWHKMLRVRRGCEMPPGLGAPHCHRSCGSAAAAGRSRDRTRHLMHHMPFWFIFSLSSVCCRQDTPERGIQC